MHIKAAILAIGNEILSGHTVDTNSVWISQQLNKLGIEVVTRMAVGDDAQAIRKAIQIGEENASILILTGGLGPTADDITKKVLADYFNAQLVCHAEVLAHIQGIFQKRNLPMLERNTQQAEVPDNCTVLFNKMGTAPGMWFSYDQKILVSLPGVPHEMKYLMAHQVLPKIQQTLTDHHIIFRSVVTAGQGESFVAERIADIEDSLPPYIRLAYTVHYRVLTLRLTGFGKDKEQLIKETEHYQSALAARLADIVIAEEEIPLAELVGNYLQIAEMKLGLAESCTGGYIAHLMTQVQGSSVNFKGSAVCYQTSIKHDVLGISQEILDNNDVVSEIVAKEMATAAARKFRADFGLGITGYIDQVPSESAVPPGTVWIAIAHGNEVITKKLLLSYDRVTNIGVAAQEALIFLLKKLRNS
jgi:nicotinamide-nucleotide amidase